MKWPHVAAHTRAGIANALATITTALIADAAPRPLASVLRTALYGWAFNLGRSGSQPPVEIAQVLAWAARRHSLPLTSLAEPVVARHALHAEPGVLPGRLLPAVIELLNELMTGTPAGTLSGVSLKD